MSNIGDVRKGGYTKGRVRDDSFLQVKQKQETYAIKIMKSWKFSTVETGIFYSGFISRIISI